MNISQATFEYCVVWIAWPCSTSLLNVCLLVRSYMVDQVESKGWCYYLIFDKALMVRVQCPLERYLAVRHTFVGDAQLSMLILGKTTTCGQALRLICYLTRQTEVTFLWRNFMGRLANLDLQYKVSPHVQSASQHAASSSVVFPQYHHDTRTSWLPRRTEKTRRQILIWALV